HPARDVHLVNALIAHIAIAGRPNPVPVVVQPFAHQRFLGGGPAPEIIINVFRDGLGSIHLADADTALVTEAPRAEDFSNVPFANPGNAFGNPAARAGLSASLNDAAMFARRFDQLPALPHVVRDGFLHIDVFACLDRPDGAE